MSTTDNNKLLVKHLAMLLIAKLNRGNIFPPSYNNPELFLSSVGSSPFIRPKKPPNVFFLCRRNVQEESRHKGTYNMRIISKAASVLWKGASIKERIVYKKLYNRVYQLFNIRNSYSYKYLPTTSVATTSLPAIAPRVATTPLAAITPLVATTTPSVAITAPPVATTPLATINPLATVTPLVATPPVATIAPLVATTETASPSESFYSYFDNNYLLADFNNSQSFFFHDYNNYNEQDQLLYINDMVIPVIYYKNNPFE